MDPRWPIIGPMNLPGYFPDVCHYPPNEFFPHEFSTHPESARRYASTRPSSPNLNISAPDYRPNCATIDGPSSSTQGLAPHGERRPVFYSPNDHIRWNRFGPPLMPPNSHFYGPPPFPWLPHHYHNPHPHEPPRWTRLPAEPDTRRLSPPFARPDSPESDNDSYSSYSGSPETYDRHREMRMDVDSMSYEELLALEERMGTVSTGLERDKIGTSMKRKEYFWDGESIDTCCICQEDFDDGDDMGVLGCGHGFHVDCVVQWLGFKNVCPICKKNALAS